MSRKGVEEKDNIYKRALDSLSSARLNLMEENSRLREIIAKKDTVYPPYMHAPWEELEHAYMEGVHIWRVGILLVARDIYILLIQITIIIMKDKISVVIKSINLFK